METLAGITTSSPGPGVVVSVLQLAAVSQSPPLAGPTHVTVDGMVLSSNRSSNTFDADTLLSDWRWLIGPAPYTVHRVTAFGDLFLQAPSGDIHFLDTTDAGFRRVASSRTRGVVGSS
jgi:hypothetical protein